MDLGRSGRLSGAQSKMSAARFRHSSLPPRHASRYTTHSAAAIGAIDHVDSPSIKMIDEANVATIYPPADQ